MLPGLDAGLMSALEGALAPKPAVAPAEAGEDETA
jgi:hypothetical protein